jgi:hypothetical protein
LKRKTRKSLTITPELAVNALRVLIAEGKIAAADVTAALKRREQLIRDLRQRLLTLERGAMSAVRMAGKRVPHRTVRRPKRKFTAARRAALKLHGRYLGHIRTLPKAARLRIKAIRERSGVQAAIGVARKLAKTSASGEKAQQGDRSRRRNYQSSQQRRLARYQERERPKPDKHGGSGAGRQQGGSGAGRERG